jgi:hypothetical protein
VDGRGFCRENGHNAESFRSRYAPAGAWGREAAMAYDPGLAERLGAIFSDRAEIREKTMFGGIGWILNGNFCVGIHKDFLIARVGETAAGPLLARPHVKLMDITGRVMKGWVMVAPEGYQDDDDLRAVIATALDYVSALPAREGRSPVGDHPARTDRRDPAGERRRTGDRQPRAPARRR